jgi:hypothetical protein
VHASIAEPSQNGLLTWRTSRARKPRNANRAARSVPRRAPRAHPPGHPLVAEYAVLNERFHNLAGDVTEGFKTVRENAEKTDASVKEQFKAIADKDAGKNRERRAIYTALGLSLLRADHQPRAPTLRARGGHP